MKINKILGIASFVITIVSAMVTFYPDELVHTAAKKVFVFTGIICFISILFFAFGKYIDIKDRIKEIIQSINTIARNLKDLGKMEDFGDLKENIIRLNESVKDMVEKAQVFNATCSTTREKVEDCQENIIARINDYSYFEYHTTEVTRQLMDLLNRNKQIDEIKIICFGRSGYGEIVQHIDERKMPIVVKIIMCNPFENSFICNKEDRSKIMNLVSDMYKKAEVYLSDIPPAIRASTVYIKGNAIWSATQSYQFQQSTSKKLELIRPKDCLIVTCNEYNRKRDFDGIVKCFESEFERLLKQSSIPEKDSNDQIFLKRI